ncbi:MAG: hypothetical protein V5A47_00290 [Bacteroidales bacterium]|nr:hypothetical protein [Bacteroidales bacterium]MBS3776275.1 hypothetical protein [Bacteroidales bacterium]
MKAKKVLFTFLVIILFSMSARSQAIKAGLGDELRLDPPLSLLTKVTFDMEFLDPALRTSLDFIFLPELRGNLDIHYSFLSKDNLNPYGIAGVNFSRMSGFNLGGGMNIPITNKLDGFVEAKYIFRYNPEASLKFGLLFIL